MSLYLRDIYNKTQGCWVLPSDLNIETDFEHVVPVDEISEDNVGVVSMTKCLQQFIYPIKLFFGCP